MKERIREFLAGKFSEAIVREDDFRGEQSFYIKPAYLSAICEALIDAPDLDINYLSDITCVDWLGHPLGESEGRFEIVYNLYSLTTHHRFFLKAMLSGDKPEIASLTPLWNGANWMEREAFDMFGINFVGHPDLTKILTPDDLEGHPLRKDFPLTYEVPVFTWNKGLPPEVIK